MSTRPVAIINEDNCIGCAICIDICPFDAIIGAQNLSHRINYEECPGCKLCINRCPTDCISMIEIDQNKDHIKEKIKFNFNRKKTRQKELNEKFSKSINSQLKNILKDL